MLPLFVAADAIHGPKVAAVVNWPTVDVVTDRNGLRKLLRWLSPSSRRKVRDFRIDIQLVGTKTLVLSRWDGSMYEPPTGRTYGYGFEGATTVAAPDCPPSGHHRGHHRAIAYVRATIFRFSWVNVLFFPIGYARFEDGSSIRG